MSLPWVTREDYNLLHTKLHEQELTCEKLNEAVSQINSNDKVIDSMKGRICELEKTVAKLEVMLLNSVAKTEILNTHISNQDIFDP